MPGLVPGIHAEPQEIISREVALRRRVDGRDKPGHDDIKLHGQRDVRVIVESAVYPDSPKTGRGR